MGRPLGSKNKPKADPLWHPLAKSGPPPAPDPLQRTVTLRALRVTIISRSTADRPREEVTVDWPSDWPLPEARDSVTVEGIAGVIAYREFDLRNRRIVLTI